MIILLNSHSLTARDRFQAEKLAVNLGERDSSATLTVSDRAPVITAGDWIRYESGPGAGIVWRVKTIDDQVEKRTRTIQLEHAVMLLKDVILFGEVKSRDISGSGANPTARQTVQYILARQSDWVLGDFAFSASNPYSFNGDDLFSALETVSGSLADCLWEYDFSRYPFRIHFRKTDGTIGTEMREDRNIRTLKRTIDRSRMYTRFYPIGKNNIHIEGDYVSKNENLYGTVSKVETENSISDRAQLRAWALERLNRHCEPAVTVSISGLDLSRATGEPLDSFTIGRMCRVPLPEFSTQITERVTKLSYGDIISDPESVTVTLANEVMDVAKILKDSASAGGRSARAGAKNDEEDHAWFVDTETHVDMVAEAVAGPGAAKDWSRVAQITVDGTGIHQRVTKAEGDLVTAFNRIDVTDERILLEANRAKGREEWLESRINVEAGKISLVVEEREGGNVIRAARIVAAINDEGSSVGIDADHVFITGRTRLSGQLTVQDGSLMVKTALLVSGSSGGNVTINNGTINARTHQVNSGGSLLFVGGQTGEYYNITTDILKGMIKSAEVSGNTLTLTPFYGDPINFSKAASVIYGSWSGKKYTVTGASNPLSTEVYGSIDGALNPNATVYARVLHDNPQDPSAQIINMEMTLAEDVANRQVTLSYNSIVKGAISAANIYNAGRNAVTIIKSGWSDNRITFTKSAGTASTQAVRIGAATGWQNGVFTYEIKDYEDDPQGVSTGYIGQTDLGNPSMAKPSIQPGTASIAGRKQAGTSQLSKSAIEVNGYLFFDVTVRGQVQKFYCPVGA